MSKLSAAEDRYILHWGEMGTRWGINRTVAQIHALLYLSPEPLTADEICERLSIARSTASTGLRELLSWGLIRPTHVLGDRRDHFETMTDVWDMFRLVLKERKRREVDPTLEMLRENVADLATDESDGTYTRDRLQEMLDFFESMTSVYEQLEVLPNNTIKRLAKAGSGLQRLIRTATDR